MSEQAKAALRSFVTTFVAVFVAAVPLSAALEGDFTWAGAAASAAFVAALRTLVAALDPGMPLYGVRKS